MNIFSDKRILNTPALLRLGAAASPTINTYEQHRLMLKVRLSALYIRAEMASSKGAVCQMIVDFLGQEGLTECGSMGGNQIVDNILETSSGAALLADLRERWNVAGGNHRNKKNEPQEVDFYADMNLSEWLEALVAEYRDI